MAGPHPSPGDPSPGERTIRARIDGRIGRLILDRPRALHALDLPMITALHAELDAWRDIPEIHAIVIEATGDRAFCAGGDVRAAREAVLAGRHDRVEAFFSAEYALNLAIARYPKPIVALIDGICMGGGLGISVHGTFRVATEHALFAMPETAIALFPDVGMSYVLPRLPGHLGTWLGLTGARLAGAEAVEAGLATHLVPRARLAALSAALATEGTAALARAATPLPTQTALTPQRPAIDSCFGELTLEAIAARLAEHGDWGAATRSTLATASPASLRWSLALLQAGSHRTLEQCLAAELELTRSVTRHPDFAEGVRAMLVDKDRAPRWEDKNVLF